MVTYSPVLTGLATALVLILLSSVAYGTYKLAVTQERHTEYTMFFELVAIVFWIVLVAVVAILGLGKVVLWASELLGFIHVSQ